MTSPRNTVAMLAFLAVPGFCLTLVLLGHAASGQMQANQQPATPSSMVRTMGTVKAITGNAIALTTDSGLELEVFVQESASVVRLPPGQKDLKDATPMSLQDVQAGDRLLARGKASADAKSVMAASIIVMKRADIASRQEQEREDWQKRGVVGLVSAVDLGSGMITLSTMVSGKSKTFVIHSTKDTRVRRYAPDSVRFQDAKPGTLDEIRPGDQLRARGTRSADGNELVAEEVVSGSFQNIAGTIVSVDPGNNTLSVMDLATKRPVTVKITADAQLKKLSPAAAEQIAAQLRSASPDASRAIARSSQTPSSDTSSSQRAGAVDLQRALSSMPRGTLEDLQKGVAVMMVTTQPAASAEVKAITLLTGVEAVLAAVPNGNGAAMLLSPWSLQSSVGDPAAP